MVEFTYDPFGRRIRKTSAQAGVVIYVYDGDDVIEELDASGTLQARFTHGPGIDEPLAMYRDDETHFYHADGLGSITSLTDDPGGEVEGRYAYDSFGNLTACFDPCTWSGITCTFFPKLPGTGRLAGGGIHQGEIWLQTKRIQKPRSE